MYKKILANFTLFFITQHSAIVSLTYENSGLRINIICDLNGGGLERDKEILEKELLALGHQVKHVTPNLKVPITEADVNIFIENPLEKFFTYAKSNYFIPNPEWYSASKEIISKFDLILCRTREVERIFHQFNKKTYYLGFTSLDRYNPDIAKEYTHFLHISGQSAQKGTKKIFQVWSHRPDLPRLITVGRYCSDPKLSNVTLLRRHIPEEEIQQMQNQCGVHLCLSETEGFGHYIWEAMSTGAVVITTDAPPMNEHILDRRCLVGYNVSKPQRLAINYYVDPILLEDVINDILALPEEELQRIGQQNRQIFLEQKDAFRRKLKVLFP
jgi:hypothetical protein